MKSLLEILMVSLIIAQAYAQQAPNSASFPGRYLPGGIWQPRNMNATLPEPTPGMPAQDSAPDGRQEIASVDWGTDVMLEGPDLFAFYGSIVEGPNGYVHIVVSHGLSMVPYYIRSTDEGISWEEGRLFWAPGDGLPAVDYQLFTNDSMVTLPFSGTGQFRCMYSSDYGTNWNGSQYLSYTGHSLGLVQHSSIIYVAASEVGNMTNMYFSTNYGVRWYDTLPRMPYMSDVFGLGVAGNRFHMVNDSPGQEVFYSWLNLGESSWIYPVRISQDSTHDSFWPKMIAWGDSNVFAIWVDYEYSPYPWTGDLICRRSTNNGESWLPEQQVTFNHLALNKNICIRNDSIFLVYDEIVLDGETNTEEVFFNLSSNAGGTWNDPVRLTYAPHRSLYPCVAVRENRIHVAWCDARNDTANGVYNSLYYKRGIISDVGIGWNYRESLPEKLSMGAYPNPFNTSTMLTIKGAKGGDITLGIYDIQGKRIKTFEKGVMGGDEKIVWDATDASGKKVSSGLYFARASTPQTEKTIKLLLLR